MINKKSRNEMRKMRHTRVRKNISGTSEIPRLNVYRSNKNIYAQIIDDEKGVTLAACSSMKESGNNLEVASKVGKAIALEAKKKKIKWLQENGADINFRDCASDFFPPITTAVQRGDYDMVCFLLDECGADPNVGSRYPYSKSTVATPNAIYITILLFALLNEYTLRLPSASVTIIKNNPLSSSVFDTAFSSSSSYSNFKSPL